jgi:hypothetical protein
VTSTTSKERKKNHFESLLRKFHAKINPAAPYTVFCLHTLYKKSRRKVENCSQKYASLENERWMISN